MAEEEKELNRIRRLFIYLAKKLAGEGGLQIASALINQGGLTDEQLSEITGLPITNIRNLLTTLRNEGILYNIKEKDMNSGWTLYYWFADPLTIKRIFKDRLRESINKLRVLMKLNQEGNFFICPECNIKFSKTDAENNNYKCPICGVDLVPAEPIIGLGKIVNKLLEKYNLATK
ncbi:MAG: hypothetical protein ACP6IQ_04900 [Candidatus Njordarchaeia archaeon]|nr:hypothetical protein [Candidatus Korarchaeota archaeon]